MIEDYTASSRELWEVWADNRERRKRLNQLEIKSGFNSIHNAFHGTPPTWKRYGHFNLLTDSQRMIDILPDI